jgi:Flp pilus assembly protein TadD/TolB-like protein
MALAPGTRLGTFEILGPLGAGGMGEVYQARDTRLGRDVAIKVLPEAFARDPVRAARFEREARLLASLNHPAIAAIYGAEASGPLQYIVMELVPGETLGERLAHGSLGLAESLLLSRQIAEALEAAHEKGVIHRDLKPSNIKVTPEGKVKVLDLGLAKAMEPPASEDISRSPTMVAEQTRPGVILGTVEFMSPEQARGKPIDKRTDIWAFGCILFEMLSGRRAFAGETVSDTLAAILDREPDWSALPARTPERIRELLHKCLEKEQARRLRDAGDARLDLEAALAGMSGAGMIAAAGRTARWKIVAGVAVGIALCVAGYLVLRPKTAGPAPTGTRQLAVLPFRNLMGTPEGELMGLAMAETVSARLANVPGLQVVTPRATVEAVDQEPNLGRVAQRLGANTLLAGTLQREKALFRITYRIVDASGNQLAANAIDGSEIFLLQDRVADGVMRDLRVRPGARRTPTASGLVTPAEQEGYLEAIGLLQRYDRRDGVEKALGILQKLADEKPNSAVVQAGLARASLAMFHFTKERSWADRAIAASDAARALDPGLPEVDVTVGETLLETGKAKEAVMAFQRTLAARPGDVEARLGLGRASEAAGDRAAAEAAFRRAIELQPSFAVFNQLGGLYWDRGRYGEAAEMFRRAVRAAPDSYWALSNLGGAETMRCNYPAAIEAYRRALALDPKNSSAASNLGMTQLWTGHVAEAVASLEKAASAGPSDYAIWGNLGDAYRAASDTADKASAAYARSIALASEQLRLNPADSEACSFVATGLAKTGHAQEATNALNKALALSDKDPNLMADAAVVAVLAGRDTEAIAWLRKAVAAGYCREIIAAQPEFARLRDNPDFRSIIAAPRNATGS